MTRLFGTDGIRGAANVDLRPTLAYALGRGLTYEDAPALRAIVRDGAAHDYRVSEIVLGIVRSTPFQMRRSRS